MGARDHVLPRGPRADRVLYAMDYSYEYEADEVRAQDNLPLTEAEKKQFFQTIAEHVFGLDRG